MDFNEVIERRGTDSLKWDYPHIVQKSQEEKDATRCALPMWVADMDFRSPEPVTKALLECAKEGLYGYTAKGTGFYGSLKSWLERRHGFQTDTSWFEYTPGVLPGIAAAIQSFTQPGDGVLVQVPVYYPFYRLIRNWDRKIVENPLLFGDEGWKMDFEDLERKAQDPNTKMMILCSPHNPVGRVWTREELTRLGEICIRNGVLVFSDEIHSDLIYEGHRHTPFASISEEFAQHSISAFSPSKTFNLAGFHTSMAVIPDSRMHMLFQMPLQRNRISAISTFGSVAFAAAYNEGEPYLAELMTHLTGNLDFLMDYLKREMPRVRMVRPQGTYLAWMDFRDCGIPPEQVDKFILTQAKVFLDYGSWFGKGGVGFGRMNFACPRPLLEQGLTQIKQALDTL